MSIFLNVNVTIIEDDKDIAELVGYNLEREKFNCRVFKSGIDGLKYITKNIPDIVILDLMLPDISGLDICRSLKADSKTKDVPIVMLTAKSEEVDRIVGFEMGADDYMTKPFSPRELVLRVKAIISRVKGRSKNETVSAPVTFGLLYFDLQRPLIKVDKEEIELTKTEIKLLEYLFSTKGRVATREMLLNSIWGYDVAVTTRTVDTHVKRLRTKLKKAGEYIETVHGIGYRFKEKT